MRWFSNSLPPSTHLQTSPSNHNPTLSHIAAPATMAAASAAPRLLAPDLPNVAGAVDARAPGPGPSLPPRRWRRPSPVCVVDTCVCQNRELRDRAALTSHPAQHAAAQATRPRNQRHDNPARTQHGTCTHVQPPDKPVEVQLHLLHQRRRHLGGQGRQDGGPVAGFGVDVWCDSCMEGRTRTPQPSNPANNVTYIGAPTAAAPPPPLSRPSSPSSKGSVYPPR